jgi:hypothetical protein
MVTIDQTKWKPDFSVIYKNTPQNINNVYTVLVDVNILSGPYSYIIINTTCITPGNHHLTSKNENGGVKEKYSNM